MGFSSKIKITQETIFGTRGNGLIPSSRHKVAVDYKEKTGPSVCNCFMIRRAKTQSSVERLCASLDTITSDPDYSLCKEQVILLGLLVNGLTQCLTIDIDRCWRT